MALLQVQTETDRPGKVLVQAKPAPGREMDARPIGGFYIRRRYAGDQFRINDWTEFSPRWMEFIEEPPAEWKEKILAREGDIRLMAEKAAEENVLTPVDLMKREMFSMASMMRPQVEQTLNQATGKVSRETLSLGK